MLAPIECSQWTAELLKESTPELFEAASTRKGEWVVYRPHANKGGLWRAVCPLSWTSVVFTEKEFSSLYHLLRHGLDTRAKETAVMGTLVMEGKRLWPDGSLEHMAMKIVGVEAMSCLLRGQQSSTRQMAWRACLMLCAAIPAAVMARARSRRVKCLAAAGFLAMVYQVWTGYWDRRSRTYVRRLSPPAAMVPPVGGDATPDPEPAVLVPPQDPGPGQDVPPPGLGSEERTQALSQVGETPGDTEVLSQADETLRVMRADGMVKVVGRNYGVSTCSYPIVGVQTGPCMEPPLVYGNTFENVESAVRERLEKKARANTWDKREREKYMSFARAACHGKLAVFSKEKVRDWLVTHWDYEDIKSGKWSTTRLATSLENLMRQAAPEFRLSAAIKAEVMPTGKAPRLLIADGDDGQLMALMTVCCFEHILFHHFEKKSIKHMGKREAVARCVDELQPPKKMVDDSGAIEGDGSAWDTTCNSVVRASENYILYHIVEVLSELGVGPRAWHDAHLNINDKKKLKLFFKGPYGNVVKKVAGIRRSGHRGTSCLNWWTNYSMWYCSVFDKPEIFLDPNVRRGKDVMGNMRWFNGCFEGDDSLVVTSPRLVEGTPIADKVLEYWEKAGFNMKIIFVTNRATFVGWHISARNGVPTPGMMSPELPRALKTNVSCSPSVKQAALAGDAPAAKQIAAAAALARASDFAGLLPSVSVKYQRYAQTLVSDMSTQRDRELSMRVEGHDSDEVDFASVMDLIDRRNLGADPAAEQTMLEALGFPASSEELHRFMCYQWDWESLDDYAGFVASVPPAWR